MYEAVTWLELGDDSRATVAAAACCCRSGHDCRSGSRMARRCRYVHRSNLSAFTLLTAVALLLHSRDFNQQPVRFQGRVPFVAPVSLTLCRAPSLEVLKVRLQTSAPTGSTAAATGVASSVNRVGRSSPAPSTLSAHPAVTTAPPPAGQRPGLRALYRAEGVRFLFAGAAGPILGLAFIDSAFFGLYGRVM